MKSIEFDDRTNIAIQYVHGSGMAQLVVVQLGVPTLTFYFSRQGIPRHICLVWQSSERVQPVMVRVV